MSEDNYTEVTHESWSSRISGALWGIIFGILFFLAAFPLLFWNEGRAVKERKTLEEGAGLVVAIDAGSIDPKNNGRLVHLTAKADTDETLTDPQFGIKVNALKLKRLVEMYQWQESSESETKKKLGGGTETVKTYTYTKTWSDTLINSSSFKKPEGHRNPEDMPYGPLRKTAGDIHLGAFTLSNSLVKGISNYSQLAVSEDTEMPEAVREKSILHDGGLYFGDNPLSPEIGDTKVYFKAARPTTVSLIAKQTGKTFAPYYTKAGGDIELLQTGAHGPEAMIKSAQRRNILITWGIRLGGFILMMLGLGTVLRPLVVLADVIPLIGNIVEAGVGFISLIIALVLSLITIAIAWIVYRPLFGITLAAIASGGIVLLIIKLKSGKAALAPPPPPQTPTT